MYKSVFTLLGPPGSGKGTLARLCAEQLGFAVLSTGDLCRRHIADGTELGKQISAITVRGELIPDELITAMVLEWLEKTLKTSKGVILDGYPRTRGQAESLVCYLKENAEISNFTVVLLDIPESLLVRRFTNRLVCSNKDCQAIYSLLVRPPLETGVCDVCGSELMRRADDKPEAVRERLKVYARHRDNVLSFYRDAGCRIETLSVDEKTIPQVFWAFEKLVKIKE